MRDRLQKVLSQAGLASRRAAEKMIQEGRVTVNGQVAQLGESVDATDQILVDGQTIAAEKLTYLMLNKPSGFITTAKDPRARETVMDLLPPLGIRLFPVGRLDKETEGLLLFTNDGTLTHKLLHPSRHVPKTYLVEVEGRLTTDNITAIQTGVDLLDGRTSPAEVKNVEFEQNSTRFLLTIHEGRKRQIRRMCGYLGRHVMYLKRLTLGPLSVAGVKLGSYRHLTSQEVKLLYNATEE
ncbi:MAG: 23S rRNA pseudouridine synthase [Bacillota bacterium]|nr:MAG: 23S rRNA pseudouridine synthase [Bacillota bacterium]MBS3950069.1 rRNA pseudouridine synthase [Peptococcaceae bacterium]